jgi:hypothetical protein
MRAVGLVASSNNRGSLGGQSWALALGQGDGLLKLKRVNSRRAE